MYRWPCHLSKSLTCGDSPRVIFPWLLELCIDDRIIRPSRWLVVTRQGGRPFDFWNLDRWSYHPSKSLTYGYSPRGISPWLLLNCGSVFQSSVQVVDLCWFTKSDISLTFGIVYRWSHHPSKSLTCGDSPRVISPSLLKSCIDDPIILLSRWLVVTRQGGRPLHFWNFDRWSNHPFKSLTWGGSPRGISLSLSLNYVSVTLSSFQVVDLWWFA